MSLSTSSASSFSALRWRLSIERCASRPSSVDGLPFFCSVVRAASSATMVFVSSVLCWAGRKAKSVGLSELLALDSAMTDFSSVCQPS